MGESEEGSINEDVFQQRPKNSFQKSKPQWAINKDWQDKGGPLRISEIIAGS